MFPGITAADIPAGSQPPGSADRRDENHKSSPPDPQQYFATASLHRVSKAPASGSKKISNDLLSQTFDVPDLEVSE